MQQLMPLFTSYKQSTWLYIDRGNNRVRIFFSDFSKGFDMNDNQIVMDELSLLCVDLVLFSWIRSLLTNRTQAVRVGNVLSDWKHTMEVYSKGPRWVSPCFQS